MRVLVACEESGVVRNAFRAKGHDAFSCDLQESSDPSSFHLQQDVLEVLSQGWDMMIAFPPCTHLACSGARWFHRKQAEQQAALEFVRSLMGADISKIAIENPVGVISSKIRKPDQIIQPWQFGHEAQKTTCLWLKNLPPLQPTNIVGKGEFVEFASGKRMPKWLADQWGKKDRSKTRSKTFEGIALAMANQWGMTE